MSHAIAVRLDINGRKHAVEVDLTETLLTTLRERLRLTAAKRGCNQGVCGACTVAIDGVPMRGCLSLSVNCEGAQVTTLEGFADDATMRALQNAFVAEAGFQCGYCTPGMLVAAHALLAANAHPDEAAVRAALSGNLCRCTGYRKIVAAVRAAAAQGGQQR